MKTRTIMQTIRRRLCAHRDMYVKASTGLERSGSRHSGNGSVGVTLTCPACGRQGCADVTMALPPEVREALWVGAMTPALVDLADALAKARAKHAPMRGPHEGYAVLLEEVDELWEEVKRRTIDPVALRKEALHVAAMAVRFIEDVCDADSRTRSAAESHVAQHRREVERAAAEEGEHEP